jgi:UDP-4-amino-4,6-dideoxy-N-acetyl-beta-L-altrosamine N-acetyltransferase
MCFKLRDATIDDCILLFNWVNDEQVRSNSFNSDKISLKEHKKWFYKNINSKTTKIFIACLKNKPIGQIRIDIKDRKGVIGFSVDSKLRGKGYGTRILEEVILHIKVSGFKIDTLIGKVKKDNISSQKAFQKAGYKEIFKEKYIMYFFEIKN